MMTCEKGWLSRTFHVKLTFVHRLTVCWSCVVHALYSKGQRSVILWFEFGLWLRSCWSVDYPTTSPGRPRAVTKHHNTHNKVDHPHVIQVITSRI